LISMTSVHDPSPSVPIFTNRTIQATRHPTQNRRAKCSLALTPPILRQSRYNSWSAGIPLGPDASHIDRVTNALAVPVSRDTHSDARGRTAVATCQEEVP
jgi:hypothetical protein